MGTLSNKKIALLATDGFEDTELSDPREAVENEGAQVVVVSDKDEITGENGTKVTCDVSVDEAVADDYDGLLIPGGVKNPDQMRMNSKAVHFVREFFNQEKPVASICHGPWMLIEAGVVEGRKMTSWPSLKTDLTNAGARWLDEQVVVDNGLVTSRNPDDLPAFCKKAVEEFAEGTHDEQRA